MESVASVSRSFLQTERLVIRSWTLINIRVSTCDTLNDNIDTADTTHVFKTPFHLSFYNTVRYTVNANLDTGTIMLCKFELCNQPSAPIYLNWIYNISHRFWAMWQKNAEFPKAYNIIYFTIKVLVEAIVSFFKWYSTNILFVYHSSFHNTILLVTTKHSVLHLIYHLQNMWNRIVCVLDYFKELIWYTKTCCKGSGCCCCGHAKYHKPRDKAYCKLLGASSTGSFCWFLEPLQGQSTGVDGVWNF